MFLRESIPANSHEGNFQFRLRQNMAAVAVTAIPLTEVGNWQAGSVSQSETGEDRFSLLQQFNNVADTSSGSGPGHLDFHPFGAAFVDPPYNPNPGDEPELKKPGVPFQSQRPLSKQRREWKANRSNSLLNLTPSTPAAPKPPSSPPPGPNCRYPS